MKFKKYALFFILPFTLGAGISPRVTFGLYSSNVLTKLTGDSNATLKLVVQPLIKTTYNTVVRLYNAKSDSLVFSQTFTDELSYSSVTHEVEYPLRYRVTGDGLRFQFNFSYSNVNKGMFGIIYPYTSINVNAQQYKNEVYSTSNRFIKVEPNEVVTGESFSFVNYNEYVSRKANGAIDLSTVKFNYLHKYTFNYAKAELHIRDYNHDLGFLMNSSDGSVVKLKCINNNGEISFEIDDNLYVNTNTLVNYAFYMSNCVKTNELFIPVGKQDIIEQLEAYILIKEAGYSYIDITIPLTFYFSKKNVGLCYMSDYCIGGGIRE